MTDPRVEEPLTVSLLCAALLSVSLSRFDRPEPRTPLHPLNPVRPIVRPAPRTPPPRTPLLVSTVHPANSVVHVCVRGDAEVLRR